MVMPRGVGEDEYNDIVQLVITEVVTVQLVVVGESSCSNCLLLP